jgi:accessory gene regulator protein AgrB
MPRRSFAPLALAVGILLYVYLTYSKSPWDPVRGLAILAISLAAITILWVWVQILAPAKNSKLPSGKIKRKLGRKKLFSLIGLAVVVILVLIMRSVVFDLVVAGIVLAGPCLYVYFGLWSEDMNLAARRYTSVSPTSDQQNDAEIQR